MFELINSSIENTRSVWLKIGGRPLSPVQLFNILFRLKVNYGQFVRLGKIENDISCFLFLVLYPLSCVFAREYGFRGFLGCGFV